MKTKSGREIYRHDSGMGSVIEWIDFSSGKQKKKFLVLDAKYRKACVFNENISLKITGMNTYPKHSRSREDNSGKFIFGNPILEHKWGTSMNDKDMFNLWRDSFDKESAKSNTQKLLESSCHVASVCNDILVGSESCSIPTIQQLIIIATEGDTLDKLDESASEFPRNLLGKNNPLSYMSCEETDGYWSSTLGSAHGNKLRAKSIMNFGYINEQLSDGCLGVVPILEL